MIEETYFQIARKTLNRLNFHKTFRPTLLMPKEKNEEQYECRINIREYLLVELTFK